MRTTLHMTAADRIPLADELTLADRFLSIEQVRFGSRLQVERHIDEAAVSTHVPPLLLQPLVENAIVHGIAGLVDGGTIEIDVRRVGDRLAIVVDNPRDPDAASPRRGGVGLENVQRRLAMAFGTHARIEAVPSPGRFRVSLDLPCGPDD
jgi:LytS/YehU family sensor histidine kinase